MHASPLILTLKLDADSFERLDGLRRTHFPPERNFLSAHVTLFHALPGEELQAIRERLQQECAMTAPMTIEFPRVRMLGRGVAIEIVSTGLSALHGRLAAGFRDWLTPQDRQGFRPHVTIQNKVPAAQARELYDSLSAGWSMAAGRSAGLMLWEYKGGPWRGVEEFCFAGG
ncbi:2'-5' RNA ligase family protein [Noviherbaspirillum sp. 17J57-3]|uniref:2'-5' RNA ligase family protein n=1 Tax=Noviherbaspirillum galbum TaxID=2709383 RepID=A0A6B3SU61_9BURK|nr:2'-5' RNA ligase family protein [Noviherbaspirillum galbum]